MTVIIGAGLSGLLAGAINQNAVICEPTDGTKVHKALLRFRTPHIGEAVGIPFKEVTVYKGIWHNDNSVPIAPRYVNLYSRKVADSLAYRSIINQQPEKRYIAPEDFNSQLRELCKDRIQYKVDIGDVLNSDDTIISTIPMKILAEVLMEKFADNTSYVMNEFDKEMPKSRPVMVSRYKIEDSNVYMTYYYTDPTMSVYRASISGDVLIIESMWDITSKEVKTVMRSFGLTGIVLEADVENYEQPNGKITPIDEDVRRKFIVDNTLNNNIYSLGRFAIWKNIVLDDVYKDILRIKEMSNKDKYEHVRRGL